jgi:hypothetical protein
MSTCISNPKHLLAHRYQQPRSLTAHGTFSRFTVFGKGRQVTKRVASTGPYTGSALRQPRGGKECLGGQCPSRRKTLSKRRQLLEGKHARTRTHTFIMAAGEVPT